MKDIFSDKDYMLWWLITQTRNAILKARQREMMELNISPLKAGILLTARFLKGEVTAYQIAKWMVLEPHSVSTIVAKMEREGLVSRKINDSKKKPFSIQLTKKGCEICYELDKMGILHEITSSLSEEQHQQLMSILWILRDAALKQIGKARAIPPFK